MKRKTRAFSLLLTLAAFLLPLALLTGPARAAWEGDGNGSAETPYQINTVEKLAKFRDIVNGTNGETQNQSAYADLTADIDLCGNANEEPTWWTPIGGDSNKFSGVFDGKGHTVKGLYVGGNLEYAGLFGCVGSGGTVKNLNVEGTVTSANDGGKVGGVVGSNDGTVESCRSAAAVTGIDSVGGVAGENRGTVESCRNTGMVSGTNVGGVVGYNIGDAATVKNCCNTGTVSGESNSGTPSTGGVVGYNGPGSPMVENCYNTGAVSSASASGNPGTGGVVGYVGGGSPVVENCYNTGAVSSASAGARIGGVVGCVGGTPTVKNCYNDGTVSGSGTVGGVVGHKDSGNMDDVQEFNGSLTAEQFADADSFPAEWFTGDGAWRMGAARPLLKAFDNATADTWDELADALRWDGTVTLTADVTTAVTLIVPAGADVTLDLNDHCVRYTGKGVSPVITLDGGALTLDDRAPKKTARFVTLNENGRATDVAESGEAGDGCLAVTGGLIAGGTGYDGYSDSGGGVYVDKDSTFTMNGGTICGNAVNGGGGVYSNNGTFNMEGGTISGNAANEGNGGGVYSNNGTFNMEGGTICGNAANVVGPAGGDGGGVYSFYCTFTMSGGTISGNTATGDAGGGVCVHNGSFTMSGTASITGNSATGNGGGVCVRYSDTAFNMAGGVITGNTAGEGGGVYVNDGTFNVSGTPAVSGNTGTDETTASNVYLSGDKSITVTGALKDSAELWVSAGSGTVVARGGSAYVLTDADAACFRGDSGNGSLVGALDEDNGAAVVRLITLWAALQARFNNASTNADAPTKITLAENVTAGEDDEALVVPAGRYVTLDLAGHVIDRALTSIATSSYGNVITVNGALTLTDSASTATHTGSYASLPGGGVLTGGFGDSGGVYVSGGGALTMTGGTITGNNADYYGGGVRVFSNGTFTMTGGTITGNNAGYYGNGVYVEGAFNISGDARVSGGNGDNVYLPSGTAITVTGALTGATPIGVTMESTGAFTSGLVHGGENALARFKSDNTNYSVFLVGGEAALAVPVTVTYDANDGAGTMEAQKLPSGLAAALSANRFTRAGYSFAGWNTQAEGKGTPYADKASVTLTAGTTLYAQWTEKTYAVTVKNGTGGGSYAEGETVKVTANAPATGKVFDKWTTTDGVTFADAGKAQTTFTMPAQAVAVTATYHDYSLANGKVYAPKGAVLICATYSGGRMTGMQSVTLAGDCANADAATLLGAALPASGYQLMLVDGATYAPLCEAFRG